jgi:hypothetical protein
MWARKEKNMDPGIIALIGVGILNVISYIIAVRGRRRR